MNKPGPFNVKTVPLGKNTNLIEASAGTGKTYSIAILALRLIIKEGIEIERILMVTFTNAAVAELELRLRKFVRKGLKYARTNTATDQEIMDVVDSEEKNIAIERLERAVRKLDLMSVFTIHAFCQKTISEFTFETGQSFEFEILKDDSQLFADSVNKYFREHLNTLKDYDLFKKIWEDIRKEEMPQLLRKIMQGMHFLDLEEDKEATRQSKLDAIKIFVESKKGEILATDPANNKLRNLIIADDVDGFIELYTKLIKDNSTSRFFLRFEFMQQKFTQLMDDFINFSYLDFFKKSKLNIDEKKRRKGIIAYDDQISTIREALKNDGFTEKMSAKYDAVFIDEFQDTDKVQHEIFEGLFGKGKGKTTFFIGDPKQSIYGWRKADLDTYTAARKSVKEHYYSMSKNFRSTTELTAALNILFKPANGTNIFHDENIRYEEVNAGAQNLGTMKDGGDPVKPVTITEFDENDHLTNIAFTAQEIYRLLDSKAIIKDREIRPSDIAVLVREGRQGVDIKAALAKYNIPSVMRNDLKVLQSDEARLIRYLIRAILNPKIGDINRALYSKYFDFSLEKIQKLNDEQHVEIFLKLRKILEEEGVFNMVSDFLDKYGIRQLCKKDVLGQRILTNITQIAEILHKTEKRFRYSPEELLIWMERSKDGDDDDFAQRIESDENAVQISTIHKCKGLSYNVVFAPFLSMIPKFKKLKKGNVNDFKDGGKYYVTLNYEDLTEEKQKLFDDQKEEENRRIIYVALTRAVYKCYISLVPIRYDKDEQQTESSLLKVLKHYQKGSHQDLIEYNILTKEQFELIKGEYKPDAEATKKFSSRVPRIPDVKNTFAINSFSSISHGHKSAPFEKAELGKEGSYEQFIFQDLPRGANVGTALHSIFEFLNFADVTTWDKSLEDASKYYSNIIKEDKVPHFKKMVEHVMRAEIKCGDQVFSLQDIPDEKKIPELEFYYSLNKADRKKIDKVLGDSASLSGESAIDGLMMGFIDLVFEHNKKYYILDWKSNHLGNSVEKYNEAGVTEAMKLNNYNLQYIIYTVALKRWLEARIPDFDYDKQFGGVIYVFLRGVREGSDSGIFTSRPEKKDMEELEKVFMENSNIDQ